MKKLRLLFLTVPFLSFGQDFGDNSLKKDILIDGNVRDENGVPLIGANVSQKGLSNEIKTNFDGNFSLTIKEGNLLIISYSGLKTKEVAVGNQTKINIILEDKNKSENIKPLTKAEIKKKKRDARRVKHSKPKPLDLKEEILKATGRSIRGTVRKKYENN